MPDPSRDFRFGVEVLLETRPAWLATARLGLVCHPASVGQDLMHSADRLREAVGPRLVALFGPQHGMRGEKQDNMIESADGFDRRLDLPVFSLYGAVREPTEEMLCSVDALLVDLQDVGTRVYTFVSTMAACLRAAARFGCKLVILDRPNPIGGTQIEGPLLEPAFRSFVGELETPMRHGRTMGELARWANARLGLGCDLEVVAMHGWRRVFYWDDLGLEWVAPSPNIPMLRSALCYPGTVLFEGTNVSEGRGTTQPFELVGAPFVDSYRLVAALERHGLAGVQLRAVSFEPTFHKWAGQLCGGVQLHVRDRAAFEPLRTAVALLAEIRALAPDDFAWRTPPYEYELHRMAIDLIAGSDRLRAGLEHGKALDWLETAGDDIARFRRETAPYELYE